MSDIDPQDPNFQQGLEDMREEIITTAFRACPRCEGWLDHVGQFFMDDDYPLAEYCWCSDCGYTEDV